jgi:DNA invertase Pin-like site-specific DNA recombinase
MENKAITKSQNTDYIAYYRVSTARQGKSGLGLDAQKELVRRYINGGTLIAEYVEVESGKKDSRPQLQAALEACKQHKATLLIAKLDRLSRDLHFISGLERAGIKFICADMPEANEFTIHILASVAQHERKLVSQRTRDALQAAKRRGVKLGNPNPEKALQKAYKVHRKQADSFAESIKPIIEEIRQKGSITTLQGIADALNARGVSTSRGGKWWPTSVKNLLNRINY